MSKIPALFSAAILLSISACQSVNQHAAEPSAVEPAVQPVVRPTRATDVAASETPVAASVSTEAAASKPAAEVKPAVPAIPAAAKVEAPVAAKPAGLGKEQALALATKGNCLVCHKIDSKLVGPAWKDVGAKYKGDANAAATIASHIKSGGSFGWKFGVMPPRGGGKLSDTDIASLAKFIAGLK